jgi:hypothetical protein
MAFSSFALNGDLGLQKQEFVDGSTIVYDASGEIIRTCDVTGVKQEFSRQPFTNRLAVRMYGIWTTPTDAKVDSAGTLSYRNGDVDIQKHLSGLQIHKNRRTGVVIQSDFANRQELVKQPHGEIWKHSITETKESFEIWFDGKLTFRSETYSHPECYELRSPSGTSVLNAVIHQEQSWENGVLTRTKISFRNEQAESRSIALKISNNGVKLDLPNVSAIVTLFTDTVPIETSYQLAAPCKLKLDPDPRRREYPNITCVRNFIDSGKTAIALRTTLGHEHIPFIQ